MTDIDEDVRLIVTAVHRCDVETANLHMRVIQQQARAAGMEEAAKICEAKFPGEIYTKYPHDGKNIAAAIRAAIEVAEEHKRATLIVDAEKQK